MTATARASLDEVRRRLEERLAAPGDHFGLDLLQQRLRSALARLKPKKYRDPVEWAEELYLPVLTSPSKPGRLRLTENQKQQLRFIVASILRDITIRKSVQIGFSLTAALAVFYVLEHLEKPAAYVSRSKDEVDKWMKLFFNPMLKDPRNRKLNRLLRRPKQNEDKDSLNERFFTNGTVFVARTAAADDAARGWTAFLVILDEIDADTYADQAGGSKLDLFRARITRFFDGRFICGGSPNQMEKSRVEAEMALTDRRQFFSPCPHCSGVVDADGRATEDVDTREKKGFQVFEFGEDDQTHGIKFLLREADHAVVQVSYACLFEKAHRIDEKSEVDGYNWREWLDRHGEYRPTAPGGEWRRGERPMEWTQDLERTDPETGKVTAVQTTALPNRGGMSCWAGENPAVTWKEIVEARLIAKRKGAGAMQAFTNNMLARAWSPRSSFREVSVSELESRTLRYPAQLPDDVIFLTAFVDAQRGKDDGRGQRVEISVYGWGRENTAYLICHHVIEGEPYSAAVEREQELFLERSYRNASGFHLKVVMAACDAGSDFSAAVKDYCRKYTDKGKGRIATHGHKDEQGTGCLYGSLINANGNYNSKRAWDFYFIDTLRGKDELAEKLELGPRIGGIFFPWSAAYLPNYFAGLNAERKMPHKKGWKWKRKGALTGEPLDCYVGAAAARDFVKARNPIFADIEQVIARAPWIVPASPSLVTNPWEGDCMSVQADDIRRVRGLPPVDGSIAARALAVMAAASSRGGGVRSALTEKPEAAIAERGPRVVAGDNGSHGGGWSGGADPGTGGWGT